MTPTLFPSPADFRRWLERHCASKKELWVGFYKQKSGKKSITYKEALDEALCFGWIDGVRKSVDEHTYTQRFTPRKARSYWSVVNQKRMAELIKLKRVAPPGLTAFKNRPKGEKAYSYESRPQKLGSAYEKQFKANVKAWEFFNTQAPWYRRTTAFWVMNAKQEETRLRRLGILIDDSEHGRRIAGLIPKSKK
jgi:uncharacterized protein YdeI (YjbR/CyaY-like superfamily)